MNYKSLRGYALSPSKGFTIIELIVVIAIVGVLASVVMVSVTSYISKARDAKVKSEVSQVAKQMQAFFAENGDFVGYYKPASLDETYSFNADPDSNAFVVYGVLQNGKYWAQDSKGSTGELTNPPDDGVYTVTEGSTPVVATCQGTCSVCAGKGSNDNFSPSYYSSGCYFDAIYCCNNYPSECSWVGESCQGNACSGTNETSCNNSCPGGGCVWQ